MSYIGAIMGRTIIYTRHCPDAGVTAGISIFQMAYWLPNNQKLYLPPAPVQRILSTDEFTTRTDIYYYASSDRLLTVGNPYYPILDGDTVTVPKVSPNQYRVFRCKLPDPNRFAFGEKSVYDPEKQRLAWCIRGVEIARGQPLGIGITGHPLYNRLEDVENPGKYPSAPGTDNRQNVGLDPKQTQMFIVGCVPAQGEHWSRALTCSNQVVKKGDCPPIQRMSGMIEDGDMGDIGYGNLDFRVLQENKSEVPLEVVDSICKYPDYLGMSKETHGNSCFFYARQARLYSRHFFNRAGVQGETVPESLYKKGKDGQAQSTLALATYSGTPSGSLVSSDAVLFNRPYWLERAQGQNNGILWNNDLFVTVLDNTRGTHFSISIATQDENDYTASNYKQYTRHVEEFELEFIFQLVKINLSTEVLAYLHGMDPSILDNWNLTLGPPNDGSLADKYRFIESLATKCPDNVEVTKPDPYKGRIFWNIDLTERLTADLDQFSLGRKFLYQHARISNRKRSLPASRNGGGTSSSSTKRRKK
ncbi:L1 protein [Iotapapillomavirus 1]|uniref:Major capsid protein L1 n=1 Tax=Mastomys natalensis papillomavirus (isolate African multimammate rat) TaxID=654915 RepID=Q84359_MNPVA|nr:L1 protein [Iotapapillomavirus 1]AAA67149.1 L1 protein [Iotapapillomavirus 1]